MSKQEALTEDAPLVVDVTCSTKVKTHWPKNGSALRMDIRKKVEPDVVADDRFMPFRPHCIDQIYCDPHHMIVSPSQYKNSFYGKTPTVSPWFASVNRHLPGLMFQQRIYNMKRYGEPWSSRGEWLSFVEKTNDEFFQALKKSGVLFYKLCEFKGSRSIRLSDLELMHNFTMEKPKRTISPSHNVVYWLRMKPVTQKAPEG